MVPCTSAANGRRVAIGAAVAATALLAAACAPSHVAWPRTPPPERLPAFAREEPQAQPLPPRPAGPGRVVVHAPFADGRCRVCHVAPQGGGMLLSAADRLCAGCHADDVRRARPHPATRSCLGCHAPHVSMVEGRIAGREELLCLRCHAAQEGRLARAHQGYPVEGARCTRCHDPHGRNADGGLRTHVHRPTGRCTNCHVASSEPDPLALIRSERETCGRCHPGADPTREATWEHAPFGAGCTACHEPHASDRPHLLAAPERAVCGGCHPEVAAGVAGRKAHAPAASGKCHACHSPHGAERKLLLVSDVPALCSSCHREWHGGDSRAPAGEENDRCLYCHDPHGSGRDGLLRRMRRVAGVP